MPDRRMPDYSEQAAAMDVVGGTASYTWMLREEAPSRDKADQWVSLRQADQQRLEDAEAKAASGCSAEEAADSDVVPVDGGRFEVRLQARQLVDRYSAVPPREPREVRRALWQRQPSNWEPLEEAHCTLVEEAYGRLLLRASENAGDGPPKVGAEVAETVALPGGDRLVRLTLSAGLKENTGRWVLTATEEDSSSWIRFASRVAVRRGCFCVYSGDAEEEFLSPDVDCLIVLVHGIGEKMWREDGSGISTKVVEFRRNLHQAQLKAAGYLYNSNTRSWEPPKKDTDTEEKQAPPMRYEVLEASWWQSVHNDELDSRLQRITLPSMPSVRQFANGAIADGLFYSQAGHRQQIVRTAAETIEAVISQFRKYHPNFSGDTVLVGHSLGGTILFELLRYGTTVKGAQLSFMPTALFTLGSPTGIFMHCANDIPSAEYTLPGGTRFFNIFHPLDPVAYRMEPLFFEALQDVVPEQVPAEGYTGGAKLHNHARNFMRWASGEMKQMEERVQSVSMQLNGGDRVDWVLQDSITLSSAGELMQAGSAHACYVPHPDVASFIYARTEAVRGTVPGAIATAFNPPPRGTVDDFCADKAAPLTSLPEASCENEAPTAAESREAADEAAECSMSSQPCSSKTGKLALHYEAGKLTLAYRQEVEETVESS